jgi:hypothetical protein
LRRDIQLAPTNVRFWLMAEFTAGQQLPSLDGREFVAAGGLMSYGANIANLFRRAAQSGTGLGLSICRAIMEDHGGKLNLSKTGTRGTSFEIVFPSAVAKHGAKLTN